MLDWVGFVWKNQPKSRKVSQLYVHADRRGLGIYETSFVGHVPHFRPNIRDNELLHYFFFKIIIIIVIIVIFILE